MPERSLAYDVQQVSYSFYGAELPAVNSLSFSVAAGEIFGILGSNGAGKTTLLRLMLGLLSPDEGAIRLFDSKVEPDAQRTKDHVGYVAQHAVPFSSLTVDESLRYSARLRGRTKKLAETEASRVSNLLGLDRKLKRRVCSSLSGGEKQLVSLGNALVAAPQMLMLDEPTNHLSSERRELVWDVLRQQCEEQGTTIVLVTHDAVEAERILQRVLILRHGEVAALGKTGELKDLTRRKLKIRAMPLGKNEQVELFLSQVEAAQWLTDAGEQASLRIESVTLDDVYRFFSQDAVEPSIHQEPLE